MSLYAADNPMHWKPFENNNKRKNFKRGLTGILTHSYEWVNTAVPALLLGWMQTREGPYCATISLLFFLQQSLHSPLLLNTHFQTSIIQAGWKLILPRKSKAKSTKDCFVGSNLRCTYCSQYVAIPLNKAKEVNFSILDLFPALTAMTRASHFWTHISVYKMEIMSPQI